MASVTDEHVAALRALLTGNLEEHERLRDQLSPDSREGYAALITAAFFEATERRFGQDYTRADVIDFVADVRARSSRISETMDPVAAERMILAVVGDEDIEDLDDRTRGALQIVLLAGLIADEELDGPALDDTLAKARALAGHLLS